jgi:hypothetical protein
VLEAPTDAEIAAAARNSLAVVGGAGYRWRDSETLEYPGERPGLGWHRHGWFRRELALLIDGDARCVPLYKQRWLDAATGRTRHSRPPDEVGRTGVCALIVALRLWAWLSSESGGVHTFTDVIPSLDSQGSRRTVQRWLQRALPQALRIQQSLRSAVIERSEPRPVEQLFPRGLSPPAGLVRRRWRDPQAVRSLWQGLAWLFGGAIELAVPTAVLLAEARGRWTAHKNSVL